MQQTRRLCIVGAIVSAIAMHTAEAQTTASDIALWSEGKMPGTSTSEPKGYLPDNGDGVMRLTNISRPQLRAFLAPKSLAFSQRSSSAPVEDIAISR
jgi:hypothetical protein